MEMFGGGKEQQFANENANLADYTNNMSTFLGRGGQGPTFDDQTLEQYMERLSMEESKFKTEEDFQKFLETGMTFPESYSFMDNFFNSSRFTEIEEGPIEQLYPFTENNPYLQHPNPFEEGMFQYREGSLNEATMAFEAAIARDPESSDIWRWLGTTHAENDEDKLAILAFKKALQCDPSNIEALLDAGVSYTNELVRDDALAHLKEWLRLQPEYTAIPQIIENNFAEESLTKQQLVIKMFLMAAEKNPTDGDLHLVLGVLWNITKEYDQAEEAFKEALKYDPNNPSLWNKLGATRANSYRANGSKDAVKAYRNAIDMKPNYVRAWANMGIAYANQGMYDLAAKYYLKALSYNNKPDHLWSYLRLALNCLNRQDLAAVVSSRNVDNFRKDFTF